MRFPLPALGLAALLLAACGPSHTPASSSSASAVAAPPSSSSGCVDTTTAREVWTTIDNRLNAIVLDPKHLGLTDVATSNALRDLQGYIADHLVAKGFTEREVDTLDSLTVVAAGCDNGPLTLDVTTTLKQDDYLRADGTVDHSDPQVGSQAHLRLTYVRAAGSWKEADDTDLDAPTPSPSSGSVI